MSSAVGSAELSTPRFTIVDTARHSDSKKAWEVCAGIAAGEIVIFDRAYVDFEHLFHLHERGVFWVTRAKQGMRYRVLESRLKKPSGNIVSDDLILLEREASVEKFPDHNCPDISSTTSTG